MLTKSQLKFVKAELLCYGLELDNKAYIELLKRNPYVMNRTLVHAMHIDMNGIIINVCVSEKFCRLSPYCMTFNNGDFILLKNHKEISIVKIIDDPFWAKERIGEYIIGDYLRPHSYECISCSPILQCGYQEKKKTCQFCSLNEYASHANINKRISPKLLAKMISKVLTHKDYEINFSSGTDLTEDKSANYYISVLQELKPFNLKNSPYISLEITPPDKDYYIEALIDNGITALIMNIEIADEKLRRKICPGKSEVSINRYFEAMQKAVCLLGPGNVSSVLIAGIQPTEDIIKMSKNLIDIGVIPTIMPFKPLDDCAMRNYSITNPQELLFISDLLESELFNAGLNPCKQNGCTKCGGCSLETIGFIKT